MSNGVVYRILAGIEKYKLTSYIQTPPTTSNCNLQDFNGKDTIYITVAFNNDKVIDYQIKLLKKYHMGSFVHLVLDNSTDNQKSQLIESICNANEIAYIKLPCNRFKLSRSHGSALNWACRNILSKTQFNYVGFLDHDCFPVKEVTWQTKLKEQPYYGVLQERDNIWYLWPGFCFFNLRLIDIDKLDFMLIHGKTDTGGKNYLTIFKDYNKDSILFPGYICRKLCDIEESDLRQATSVEVFDDEWIHLMNGSNWLKLESEGKNIEVEKYLEKYF